MSKLAAISAKPMTREFAQGTAQDMTSAVADFLAPTVSVSTSVGYYKEYTAKNRFRIPDTRRGVGGRATEIGFTAGDKNYNCTPHALDFPVDNLEKLEEADIENTLQEGAEMIAEVAGLGHEKTVIDVALEAVGAGTALAIGANDDIVDQFDTAIMAVMKATKSGGSMGIGIIIGANAWRKIKNHPSIKSRFAGGGKKDPINPTLTDFASLLIGKVDVRISLLCFDNAPEGLPEDTQFILDGDVLIFARRETPTRRDSSFMKTFRLRGQWMVPGTYMRDDGRVEVAKFDWSEDVKVTNAAAAIRFTVDIDP